MRIPSASPDRTPVRGPPRRTEEGDETVLAGIERSRVSLGITAVRHHCHRARLQHAWWRAVCDQCRLQPRLEIGHRLRGTQPAIWQDAYSTAPDPQSGLGPIIGWGAYKGSAWAGCPADSSGWNLHIYLSTEFFGEECLDDEDSTAVGDDAQNVSLNLNRASSCNGTVAWKGYLEGIRLTCLTLVGIVPSGNGRVVSRVRDPQSNAWIDVRFTEIDRLKTDDTWTSVTNGDSCAAPTYRARVIASDDVWLERIP